MKKYLLNLAAALAVVALALPSHQAFAKRTITCSDGTTSTATGRGACSGHGGVMKKAKAEKRTATTSAKAEKRTKATTSAKAEKRTKASTSAKAEKREKSAAAEAPAAGAPTRRAGPSDAAGATAKCKDGTYSHAQHHQGACSNHGGVAEWLMR